MNDAMVDRINSVTEAPNLSDAGTVASVAGILGNAVRFDTNSANFLFSDAALFDFKAGETRAISFWFRYSNNIASSRQAVGVWQDSTGQRSWRVRGGRTFEVSADGDAVTLVNSGILPSLNIWSLCVAYYDADAQEIGISTNGGAYVTTSHIGGFNGNSTAQFRVGRDGASTMFEGDIDELAILTFVPTADDVAFLYNGGFGRTYDEWISRVGTGGEFQTDGLWYQLDEVDGDRADLVEGAIGLTQTGFVGNAPGLLGNAALFNGVDANYLSSTSDAFKPPGSIHIAVWIYFNSLSAQIILGQWDEPSNGRSYLIRTDGSAIEFAISADGISENTVSVGGLSTGEWLWVDAYYNGQTNEIGIAVNQGRHETAEHSGGAIGGGTPFYLGRDGQGLTPYDGRLSGLVILNSLLSETDRSFLFNGGQQRSYADWQTYKSISTASLINLTGSRIEAARLAAFNAAKGQIYTPQEVIDEVALFDWYDLLPVGSNLLTAAGGVAQGGDEITQIKSVTTKNQLTATVGNGVVKVATGAISDGSLFTGPITQNANQALLLVGSKAIAATDETVLDIDATVDQRFAIFGDGVNQLSYLDANGWQDSAVDLANDPAIYAWNIGTGISFRQDGAEVGAGLATPESGEVATSATWLNGISGVEPASINVQGLLYRASSTPLTLGIIERFLDEYYLKGSAAAFGAWFELDEASGDRLNSFTGGQPLISHGDVDSQGGLARFNGDSQNYLSSDEPFLRFANETRSGWCVVTINRLDQLMVILSVSDGSTQIGYELRYRSNPNCFEFLVSSDGTATASCTTYQASGSPTLQIQTPYFLAYYHDAANDLIGISINGGDFYTQIFSGGIFPSNASFFVGRLDGESPASFDGTIGKLGFSDTLPAYDDLAFLYNGGTYQTYAGWRARIDALSTVNTPDAAVNFAAASFPNLPASAIGAAEVAANAAAREANIKQGSNAYVAQDVVDELAKGVWFDCRRPDNLFTERSGGVPIEQFVEDHVLRIESVAQTNEITLLEDRSPGPRYSFTQDRLKVTADTFIPTLLQDPALQGKDSERFIGTVDADAYMSLVVAGSSLHATFSSVNLNQETVLNILGGGDDLLQRRFLNSTGSRSYNSQELGDRQDRLAYVVSDGAANIDYWLCDVDHGNGDRVLSWDINASNIRFRVDSNTATLLADDEELIGGSETVNNPGVGPSPLSPAPSPAYWFGAYNDAPILAPATRSELTANLYGVFFASANSQAQDIDIELIELFFKHFYLI